MTQIINKTAEVNSYYFAGGKKLKSFPKQITVDKQHYTFRDGLQLLAETSEGLVKFFTMTDGITNYRLSLKSGKWTLLSLEQ